VLIVLTSSLSHAQQKGQPKPPAAPKFALPGTTPAPAPGTPPAAPEKPADKKNDPKPEKERVPVKLDIKKFGRPEGKELDVSSRYYLWSDGDGWHLRSCCKDGYFATFKGEIRLTNGGTFEKFRTIELERKGQHPDAWQVSEDRTKLEFVINSSDHPDGFDFTVKGKEATVIFDLKVSGKEQPKRIFIGHDNLHPPSAYFEFPAKHD
ncbi:MAG TPA: hypothetical protein VM510_06840, partial [Caulifigura sp.]|nr:hypothetical protein [Caulifigura sp.]